MPVPSSCEVAALFRFVRSTVVATFACAAFAAAALGTKPVLADAPPAPPTPVATSAVAVPAATTAGAPTPIPVIAAPTDPPLPGATASAPAETGRHRGRHRASASPGPAASAPAPTPTPTVPGFATLDGTWEVQLQYPDTTDYSYLEIKQAGTALSGAWKVKKQVFAFQDGDCTYDGKLIRIVAKTDKGMATFAGYVENGTDMVGTLDLGDKSDPTPFTAGHRGKDKGLFGPGIGPAGLPGANAGGAPNYPH